MHHLLLALFVIAYLTIKEKIDIQHLESHQIVLIVIAIALIYLSLQDYGYIKENFSPERSIPGRLAYYDFENVGSDGIVHDVWGSANNASVSLPHTPITTTLAKFGKHSVFFEGNPYATASTAKRISIPQMTIVNANGISVSFWFYQVGNPQGGDSLVFDINNGSGGNIYFWNGKGSTNYSFCGSKPISVTSNAWHHVVGTVTSAGVSNWYLDGNTTSQGTASGVSYPTSTILGSGRIGKAITAHKVFHGYVDDVRIFNHVLKAGEVRALHNLHVL